MDLQPKIAKTLSSQCLVISLHVVHCADGALGMPGPPAAAFTGLPADKVLTLNMDEPESWLVEPVRAVLDLDNLRLGMENVSEP